MRNDAVSSLKLKPHASSRTELVSHPGTTPKRVLSIKSKASLFDTPSFDQESRMSAGSSASRVPIPPSSAPGASNSAATAVASARDSLKGGASNSGQNTKTEKANQVKCIQIELDHNASSVQFLSSVSKEPFCIIK